MFTWHVLFSLYIKKNGWYGSSLWWSAMVNQLCVCVYVCLCVCVCVWARVCVCFGLRVGFQRYWCLAHWTCGLFVTATTTTMCSVQFHRALNKCLFSIHDSHVIDQGSLWMCWLSDVIILSTHSFLIQSCALQKHPRVLKLPALTAATSQITEASTHESQPTFTHTEELQATVTQRTSRLR